MKTYRVEVLELHSVVMHVLAETPADAVQKIRDGDGEQIEDKGFLETAELYGMSEDLMRESGIDTDECGEEYLEGIRSVECIDD